MKIVVDDEGDGVVCGKDSWKGKVLCIGCYGELHVEKVEGGGGNEN